MSFIVKMILVIVLSAAAGMFWAFILPGNPLSLVLSMISGFLIGFVIANIGD